MRNEEWEYLLWGLIVDHGSLDVDGDLVDYAEDNCPETANGDQTDADSDGTGDVCDTCPHDPQDDLDADGVCGDADNCPMVANPAQADQDGDSVGDACDNCPTVVNIDQVDTNADGTGDECQCLNIDCDDGNLCTTDLCIPSAGCVHTPLACSLKLISPNGGERCGTGDLAMIQWQAPTKAVKFDLQYTVDNGTNWKVVVKGIAGYSYGWRPPAQAGNRPKSKVRVTARNSSGAQIGADASDAPFTIEVVRLDNPNGGESLTSEATATIRWTTNATVRSVAKVKLLYTIDGGTTWKAITTVTGDPGSVPWTVPTVNAEKTNCKVRVILQDSAGASLGKDNSDLKFTIHP